MSACHDRQMSLDGT